MTVAVVTACNAAFLTGARGMMRSVRRHHPHVSIYCFAPKAEVEAVRDGLAGLATVLPQPRPVAGVGDDWKAQLYAVRVFMTTVPEDVIAWVDCDVVFRRPADALWDVPPGKVNVVRDAVYNLGHMVAPDLWPYFSTQFGYNQAQVGFNAGIHALRKADWVDLPERFERAIVDGRYPRYIAGFEQALLNGLFLPHTHWLPAEYNWHALFEFGVPRSARVLHYTDNPKPWMPGYKPHWPGYADWQEYGEECSAGRVRMLRAYYTASLPRRVGYKAVRKVLTKAGVWRHSVGVADATVEARS